MLAKAQDYNPATQDIFLNKKEDLE